MALEGFPIERLPQEWELVPFEECCARVADNRAPNTIKNSRYLGLEHLESGFPKLVGMGNGSDVISAKTAFRSGDVLFGKLRPYLRKGLRVDFDGVCSTDILVFRAKAKTRSDYLGYLVHANPFIAHAVNTTSGVNHPRTSWDALRKFNIPRPPEHEQRAIAFVMSEVQHVIERQERLVTLIAELKSALLRMLFTKGTRDERIRQTQIGGMPESWKPTSLGTCCEIISGSMSYGDFTRTSNHPGSDAVQSMAVKVSDMNVPGNEEAFVTAKSLKQLPLALAKTKLVPPGAVVFPKRGAAIATNKKRQTTTWTALDPNLIAILAGKDVDSRFLFYWSHMFDLRTITDPGPTPQLNKKDLSPVKMPLPPTLEEQRLIASVLDSLSHVLAVQHSIASAMRRLFNALLHQLITAQVRINDLSLPAVAEKAAEL